MSKNDCEDNQQLRIITTEYFCFRNVRKWRSWYIYCKQTHFIRGHLSVSLTQNKHTHMQIRWHFGLAKGTIRSFCDVSSHFEYQSVQLRSNTLADTHLWMQKCKIFACQKMQLCKYGIRCRTTWLLGYPFNEIVWSQFNEGNDFRAAIASRTHQPHQHVSEQIEQTKRDKNRPFNIYLPQHNLYVAHCE